MKHISFTTQSLCLFLSVFAAVFVFSGCAAMQQDYENRMCNYDGAYEAGANAARQNGEMSGNSIAGQCPGESHDAVMKGYRAGYSSVADRPLPPPAPAPFIVINPGEGYQTAPPPPPPQQCVMSFGRRVCGWNCKEAFGQVRCAQNPNHRCMEAYGKIYCGANCREEYGKVTCDEWD